MRGTQENHSEIAAPSLGSQMVKKRNSSEDLQLQQREQEVGERVDVGDVFGARVEIA